MPTRDLSDEEYRTTFMNPDNEGPSQLHKNALERALDIRKFEIDLYWRRATYFWTFIAATLAGFVALQASMAPADKKELLSVLLCNLGIAFSFGWFCANRGSKHWQENWEKHVDMLEDKVQGPLYKVILTRGTPKGVWQRLSHLLTGPTPISVSKINQLISAYVTLVWIVLLVYVLPPIKCSSPINWTYLSTCLLTVALSAAFLTLGRSYGGGYWHEATIRTSKIKSEPPPIEGPRE